MNGITYYKNDATGELDTPHRIGTDEEGRNLYQFVEGYTPVDGDGNEIPSLCCGADGNWFVDASDEAIVSE